MRRERHEGKPVGKFGVTNTCMPSPISILYENALVVDVYLIDTLNESFLVLV